MDKQRVGIDIIAVGRVRDLLTRHPESFRQNYFTVAEREYCDQYRQPEERYAGRFAAKEAIAKALQTGFGAQLSFLDLEIKNHDSGAPYVTISDRVKGNFNIKNIELSISHCKEYATAIAMITLNAP